MLDILVYISLALFFLGLSYKVSNWFTRKFGYIGRSTSTTQRMRSAARGLVGVLFSAKLLLLLKAVLVDVLLQGRVFREGIVRWLSHMLIFYGFILLLLMHALHSQITEVWFPDYYPTLNPFWFLRDLFGAMVLTGVALAAIRRFLAGPSRLRSGGQDHYAIIILAVIMLSGISLEGLKISSYSEFRYMVEDYAGLDDEQEIEALEAYWVREYGLVAPENPGL